jgi:hypothetical protein
MGLKETPDFRATEVSPKIKAVLARIDEINAAVDGDYIPGEMVAYIDEDHEVAFVDEDGYSPDDPPPYKGRRLSLIAEEVEPHDDYSEGSTS